MSFSPDGTLLAVAGKHGLELFDAGTAEAMLSRFENDSTGLAFAADGHRLAMSGQRDFGKYPRGLLVLHLEANRGVQVLHGLTATIAKTCLSANRQRVAALGNDWRLAVWDLASGQCVGRFSMPPPHNKYPDNADIALDDVGGRLACGADAKVMEWDVASGRVVARYDLFPSLNNVLAYDASRKLLSLRVETRSGKLPPGAEPYQVDPRVCRFRRLGGADDVTLVATVEDFNHYVFPILKAGDGSMVMIEGLQDGRRRMVQAFELATGRRLWEIESAQEISTAGGRLWGIDPLGRQAMLSLQEGRSQIIDAWTGRLQNAALRDKRHGDVLGPHGLTWLRSGPVDATGHASGFLLFRADHDGPLAKLLSENDDSEMPSFSLDGKVLAIGAKDGAVRVLNLPRIRERLSEIGLGWPE